MADEANSNRTHEPSLRELTIELDGLRQLLFSKIDDLKELLKERDRLYQERHDSGKVALETALATVSKAEGVGKTGKEDTRALVALVIAFVSILIAVGTVLMKATGH